MRRTSNHENRCGNVYQPTQGPLGFQRGRPVDTDVMAAVEGAIPTGISSPEPSLSKADVKSAKDKPKDKFEPVVFSKVDHLLQLRPPLHDVQVATFTLRGFTCGL